MRKAKNLLVGLLSTVCLISFLPFAANADSFYEGNLNYTILTTGANATVRIDGYRTAPTSSTALVIPDTITHSGVTYKVTQIYREAFKNVDTISSVTIGKYVTSIGNSAFYDCDGITTVTHNSNIALTELSDECFRNCDALTTVTLPTSLRTINGGYGGGCFEGCARLQTINLSALTNLQTIERSAFYNCRALTGITLPDSLQSIGDVAFYDCDSLTSVNIPNSLTSLGNSAFYDCDGLTTITSGPSCVLTELGNEAFRGCDALTTATLPTSLLKINGGFGGGCFENCPRLRTVNLSELTHLLNIERAAFYNCPALTGITLPDSLQSIGDVAFRDCDSITSVNIPNSLTSLGNSAFYDCDGLTTITSGPSCVLTELGNETFRGCDALTTATLPTSLLKINGGFGGGCFENCTRLQTVNFSSLTNLQSIERAAFYNCPALTGITLPDSLQSIGDVAFRDCDSITSVNIPNSLISLGNSAFYDCDGLTTITSGPSCVLTELGDEAFRDCDSLSSISLPASLEVINGSYGGGCFEDCTSLTTLDLSSNTNLRTINRAAFYNCTGLTRVILPDSLETIGPLAFARCGNLDVVHLPKSAAPSVSDSSFVSDVATIYVPVGATGYEEDNWENYNVVYGNPPAPTPITTPTPAPTAAPVSETGASGFVERLYTVALGRSSDPNGQAAWVNTITSGENTGADVARGFLYSREFLNKDVTDEEFVRVLYRTFFDREADEGGLRGWMNELANGKSKEHVIEGFINSTEWANLCLSYGIPSGGTGVPSIEVEPNQQTIDFCTRLYTTCLGRAADQNGLMAWARQLANQRDSGSGAARGFFFSTEFTGQNVSNGEYVIRLYRTFMGREPDQSGYDAWVAQLNEGVSREVVFEGFAQSPEFTRICASYGIVR
ncbi:MAG: leucine-rich repeat protein [Clostridiales bacterium]|nr:leucine-rich repeat protein [Clostridiales bacterium]